MIVHLETDNPKSIEQKVQELILKKLYIKVDDEQIFIDKEVFIDLILKDVIVLAMADYLDKTPLELAIETQPNYSSIPEIKQKELDDAAMEFEVEIEAYKLYMDEMLEKMPEDDIYDDVLFALNSEPDFLEKKLHELMMLSLGRRLSESDAANLNVTRNQLLDVFANQVKLIASYDNMDDSVDAAYDEYENYPKKHLVKKENIKKEFERFAPLVKDEIDAYKFALSLEDQVAEYAMILATVKQCLGLKNVDNQENEELTLDQIKKIKEYLSIEEATLLQAKSGLEQINKGCGMSFEETTSLAICTRRLLSIAQVVIPNSQNKEIDELIANPILYDVIKNTADSEWQPIIEYYYNEYSM